MTQEERDSQKPAQENDDPSFEVILGELESLVQELESGALPLEESLQSFERGMTLAGKGSALLDHAEKKVEILLNKGEGAGTRIPMENDSFEG
jgi:exodeoxyribonuclease VII small subunit